jgi:hypothetical protein
MKHATHAGLGFGTVVVALGAMREALLRPWGRC